MSETYWSCHCGRWTASEPFAIWARDEQDRCRVRDGCGSPLVRHVEVWRWRVER
jgi:hypothetical protein